MQKTTLISIFLIILLSIIVYATTISYTTEDATIDQSGTVGTWATNHSLSNITDANYTTYAVTKVNLTYAMINFSKIDGSGDLSDVQITYNTSSGSTGTNYTLSDYLKCWSNDNDKLLFRLASNFTQNLSNNIIYENVTPIVMKVFDEVITLLNDTAVALDNVNVIANTLTVFNRTININVVNETITPLVMTVRNESVTLLNDTAVALDNINVIVNTLTVFNQTIRVNVVNETNLTNSNLIWENGSNSTLLNTNIVDSIKVYNCSTRIAVTNETNTTLNNLEWINGTNMTLANTNLVSNSSLKLYNCTTPYTEIGRYNFTFFNDGNIFVIDNGTIGDNNVICANYTYQGLGYGQELGSGNFTTFIDGNIFMTSNTTFSDGYGFCANYTYHGSGYGRALGVNNYTLDLTVGTITLNDTSYNNTAFGVNYTYSTPITLENTLVTTSSVFNRTANTTSLNESGHTWLNDTNLTLANNRLTERLQIYNCSGSSYEELGSGNWTVYSADGKIFMTSNGTFADGLPICINYSYWGSGYGAELSSSNYSVNYSSGNLSILDAHWNETLGINYTYHSIGYGEEIGTNNYTLDLTVGTITLNDTSYNNTAVGVNYTYSTPITLANTRVINSSVRLFNRTANLTSLNESGFTWLNNTNLTLANDDLTGLLRIYNCSGSSYEELGSGNWTEYTTDGKVFITSNGTFADGQAVCINYSYWGIGYGEAVLDSNYSIDYLSGNLSILDSHWNETLGINYTYLSDSTEKNKGECYNGSDWILLGTESDQDEIFDIRMFWSVLGKVWDIDYYIVSPRGVIDADYYTSTSTSILFNITANLTRSANNQTTVNVSLWTKVNNFSLPFTLNISDQVLINTSYINATVNFNDGDRIKWYWSFRDNQSRSIENTSIRTIDITIDYATISIESVFNVSTLTGDTSIAGVYSSAGSQGLTMQLNLTDCNMTITGGLMTAYTGVGCSIS